MFPVARLPFFTHTHTYPPPTPRRQGSIFYPHQNLQKSAGCAILSTRSSDAINTTPPKKNKNTQGPYKNTQGPYPEPPINTNTQVFFGAFCQGMLGLQLFANKWVFRVTPLKVSHFWQGFADFATEKTRCCSFLFFGWVHHLKSSKTNVMVVSCPTKTTQGPPARCAYLGSSFSSPGLGAEAPRLGGGEEARQGEPRGGADPGTPVSVCVLSFFCGFSV